MGREEGGFREAAEVVEGLVWVVRWEEALERAVMSQWVRRYCSISVEYEVERRRAAKDGGRTSQPHLQI
jgi:hypothetical protein